MFPGLLTSVRDDRWINCERLIKINYVEKALEKCYRNYKGFGCYRNSSAVHLMLLGTECGSICEFAHFGTEHFCGESAKKRTGAACDHPTKFFRKSHKFYIFQ